MLLQKISGAQKHKENLNPSGWNHGKHTKKLSFPYNDVIIISY